MTQLNDITKTHAYPVAIEDERGIALGTTLIVTSGRDGRGRRILIDKDGLAWVNPPLGSKLRHVRAPEFDRPDD